MEGDEYVAVAYDEAAPEGQIHRFGVSVPAVDVPAADGTTTDDGDGGVSFDFVSASGFGTPYSGNSTRDNEGLVDDRRDAGWKCSDLRFRGPRPTTA